MLNPHLYFKDYISFVNQFLGIPKKHTPNPSQEGNTGAVSQMEVGFPYQIPTIKETYHCRLGKGHTSYLRLSF